MPADIIYGHQLKEFFFSKTPVFIQYYDNYLKQYAEEPRSEYSFFSNILEPCITDLYKNNNKEELRLIWNLINFLLIYGSDSVQNELWLVLIEELNYSDHFDFMMEATKKRFV